MSAVARQKFLPIALTFFLCGFSPTERLVAQSEARVVGQVTLRATKTAISNATVLIEGTELIARSDSNGRFALARVPSGPQTLLVRYLGYAPSRTAIIAPNSGSIMVNVSLARSALQLDQLIVTADRTGRARGELGTATVIDRDAIANQIASSLQGILELIPGAALQPPGLDAAAQFSLRSLAAPTSTSSGAGGPGAADIGSAGTLIVLDGIPLSNNANLQSVSNRGEIAPPASTAGGGIDLRRIPATALDRVEVIRGIPSVRWGDLTQGVIVVDTRASAVAPEFAARFDPRTGEGNVVGGRAFSSDKQALTLTLNVAQTDAARTLSSATTTRTAGQLAHRLNLGLAPGNQLSADGSTPRAQLTLDTRADWYQLKYDSPERTDVEVGRNSFQNDKGIRVGERARLAVKGGVLELTSAIDAQSQDTRETKRLGRATAPFSDRLTEGRNIGTFIEGTYLAAYELRGAPRLFYNRLEYELNRPRSPYLKQFRFGAELRREWNNGAGYEFAIDRPPETGAFDGVNGYDRPRRFDGTPPLVTSAAYADTRLATTHFGIVTELQAGLRFDVLHDGSWWVSGAQSTSLQPRVNLQVSLKPWLRLRGGIGVVSKMPTIAQLHPPLQYFDVVNVNRFTPDPRERLAVLTTSIRDPANTNLGMSRGVSNEVGVELDGGARRGALGITLFDNHLQNAITIRRDASSLPVDRYALADTGRGTGQPGRIVDPPISNDPVPIFIDRYVNGGRLGNRGVEFTLALPVIPALRTRLEVSGATVTTHFATSDRDFGSFGAVNSFEIDTAIKRIPYFNGAIQESKRSIVTWRFVHHQPELGLVITATLQQQLSEQTSITSPTDSLSFVGYVTRSGVLVPVDAASRGLPAYSDLRRRVAINSSTRLPNSNLVSLQIAKSIPGNSRLSFYVFNAIDRIASFSNSAVRQSPPMRFGAELTLPTSAIFSRN